MKKLTLTTAVAVAVCATSVYAHHPSEGISPNFDDVTLQLEAVESPHLDMDLDAMGSAAGMEEGSSAMEIATRALSGWVASQTQAGEVPPLEPDPPVDTMDLMEEVDSALAE